MKNRSYRFCVLGIIISIIICATHIPAYATDVQNELQGYTTISDGFKCALQNDNFSLFYNSSTDEIALQNRTNGIIQYSNPINRSSDTLAEGEKKMSLNSQIILYYYEDNVLREMNSYYYSTQMGQSSKKIKKDKLYVTYQFGKETYSIDRLPQVISRKRMEKEILPKLNSKDRNLIKDNYILYSRSELDDAAYEAIKANFSAIKKHDIYVRIAPEYLVEDIWKVLSKTGYTLKDLASDCEENDIENKYVEPPIFTVELEYSLNDKGFSVTCDPNKIKYNGEYKPVRIVILPYFGAAGIEETGYMLVPDGCGAVINYNNGKIKSNEYWRSLFGDDTAIIKSEKSTERQELLLPIFASSSTDSGFLATIDSGYENAGITADIAGKSTSYNYVTAFFDIFTTDIAVIGGGTANNSVLNSSKKCFSAKFSISYYPVYEETTYDKFAVMYRDILENSGLLKSKSEGFDTSLNIELIGTVGVRKKFFGFPYDTIAPATSFEQALEIVDQLKCLNVDIKYINSLAGGIYQKNAASVKPVKALGSKKTLIKIKDKVDNIYFSQYATRQKKASKSSVAKTLGGKLSKIYEYDLISRQMNKNKFMFQLSTKVLNKNAEKIIKTAKRNSIDAINILDVGYELNSDLNEKSIIDTFEGRKNIQAYFQQLSQGMKVSVEKGAVYSFLYADKIFDAPITNSGYSIFDYSVPFYGIVLRGSIPLVTEPINTSVDFDNQFLKTVEIGGQLQYSWLYEYVDNLINTEENYYDRDFRNTIKQANKFANRIKDFNDVFNNSKIISHQQISDSLVVVEYDCNAKVLINFGVTSVSYNGIEVPSKDFVIA